MYSALGELENLLDEALAAPAAPEAVEVSLPCSEELVSSDKCDYTANSSHTIEHRKLSKHKGKMYSCNKCEYKTCDRKNLNRHKLSIHEGVKYACDQCDYKATQQGNLKLHKQSTHEGVKYSCDQCDYKCTKKKIKGTQASNS